VVLEPLSEAHRDALFACARHPQIWEHWSFDPSVSERAFDTWMKDAIAGAAAGGDSHFATIRRSDGVAVGSTSFCEVDERNRGLEIGWTWLTPAVWGSGVNTEAKFLQLRYAFEELGAIRVQWDTYERNARSRAALVKLGAQLEGILRNHSIRQTDGSKVASALYSVTDDEWPTVRANLLERIERAAPEGGDGRRAFRR